MIRNQNSACNKVTEFMFLEIHYAIGIYMVSIKLKNMECVALCMVTSVQHKYIYIYI